MIKNVFIFLGTFAVGALAALVIRAAAYQPHVEASPASPAPAPAPAVDHSQHGAMAEPKTQTPKPPTAVAAAPAAAAPVNTVCAICGMKVDPSLPTLEYQGKRIGFGCRMCPPKFKAEPDKYGPYYLRNEVIKR